MNKLNKKKNFGLFFISHSFFLTLLKNKTLIHIILFGYIIKNK